MPPPKKDEPGYAEYREQYALCDQSQLVDYATVDIPASSTANNVIGARSTRIMFPTIAFPSHEFLSGSAAGPRDSWRAIRPHIRPGPSTSPGQPGNDRDDAQAQKHRQIAQAQRPGDQHRRALSCRSCEEHVPARHAGWPH